MAGSIMPAAMCVKNATNTLQVTSFSFNAFPSFSFKQKLIFISLIYHVNSFYKGLYLCHGAPGIHSVKFDNFGVPYQVPSMSLQRILVKLRMFIKLSLITWMEVVFRTLFCLCAKCENVLTLRDTPQLRDIEGMSNLLISTNGRAQRNKCRYPIYAVGWFSSSRNLL